MSQPTKDRASFGSILFVVLPNGPVESQFKHLIPRLLASGPAPRQKNVSSVGFPLGPNSEERSVQ
jgi:hypothetical protein